MAVKPRGPTQPGIDPPRYLIKRIRMSGIVLADILRFIPIVLYFWAYWNNKEVLRRGVRTAALTILSVSSFLLLLAHATEKLPRFEPIHIERRPGFEIVVAIALAACVVVLFFHHRKELRNQYAELVLAERIWQFMIRRGFSSWDSCISTALRLFSEIYASLGIAHVSVALPINGELIINPKHVYPKENRKSFYQRLSLNSEVAGGGVAGSVFHDGNPRYVPRLFYPFNAFGRRFSLFFPHALVFQLEKDAVHFDLVKPTVDFNVFETSFGDPFVFKSFVSVPLRPSGQAHSLGVLNFDFATTDPLARGHIKTAVVLALILADELARTPRQANTNTA